jgi:two-component system, cell cycle sensor histidine kinase and response regulator CckA
MTVPTPPPSRIGGADDHPSPFPPALAGVLADLSGVGFRREMQPGGSVRYSWFSADTAGIFGYPAEAMTVGPKGALNVIHWADRDSHVAEIRRSAATLERCHEEFRAVTAAGETRWFRGSSQPQRLAGDVIAWDGVWLDITPWMRAEHQHQMLMDHAEDCILTIQAGTGINWANSAAERLFGYGPGELTGHCMGDLIDDNTTTICACRASTCGTDAVAGFARGSSEVMGRHKGGTRFPFEMTVSEVRSDGRLSLIVIGRDITRRKATEMMLRDSEERLRITFAAASLGIVVVSLNGTIQYYNPAFKAITGRNDYELWGSNFHAFIEHDHLPSNRDLPPPGESFCLVYEPNMPDGSTHHWRVTGTQFSATPDAPTPSLLFFIEDVTEVTKAASERRQLELALQEGQKLEALGRLAGGVAHELNNMLGPIMMGAQMIARTAQLDDKNAERLTRIVDAAKTSGDIVRNVLAYCRKEPKTLSPLDVVPVFRQFASLAASILPPGVKVETRIEMAEAMALADPGQLQQIFLNLANNARDAMNAVGTLTLSLAEVPPGAPLNPLRPTSGRRSFVPGETRIEDSRANPLAVLDASLAHVEIRFTDTGSGMSLATIDRIFDPFFTTKPVGQGTGLGLSVVQGIIKTMGGVIAVESAPGQGTAFRILLPLAGSNAQCGRHC